MKCAHYEPPDGGWGWVIMVSYSISTMVITPIFQNFVLLFKDIFRDLNFSTTNISLITNLNVSFGLFLGPVWSPLIKKFGYRKIAAVGSLLTFIGLVLTSSASNLLEFLIYYGGITSIGYGAVMMGFSIALNTYFSKRRNRAIGVYSGTSSLGGIIMPMEISFLSHHYGPRGACLIISGIAAHSLCCALLLHPLHWHSKLKEGDLESFQNTGRPQQTDVKEVSCWQRFINNFDLDLLKDPVFLLFLTGLSISYASERNFTFFTPLLLQDKGFSMESSASMLSVISLSEVIFKFLSPYIGELTHLDAPCIYALSLVCLVVSKAAFLEVTSFASMMGVCFALGIGRSFRNVYKSIVIPNYVPLNKLPSSHGLLGLTTALSHLVIGPLIGLLKDLSGSYSVCVDAINALTAASAGLVLAGVWIDRRKRNPKEEVEITRL